MESLLLASFVAGFLTVLAPCLLPLLPVVIGGSAVSGKGNKWGPYIIIGTLLASIIVFTLIIEGLSSLFYISDTVWRVLSGVVLLFVGLTFVFPSFWYRLPFVSRFSITTNKQLGKSAQSSGVFRDVFVGISLGPVFTSCSPTYLLILAVVLPRSLAEGALYLSSYVLGLGIVLLFIALLGQTVVEKLMKLTGGESKFKLIVGVIMLLIALAIFTGFDKTLGSLFLDLGLFDISQLEI